jgi:hypothetical protein
MNNTTMMLTTATLFALLVTAVHALPASAAAQADSSVAKRPESAFACSRLALTHQGRHGSRQF